jgi:K+-sensing histidine kinase KdpD
MAKATGAGLTADRRRCDLGAAVAAAVVRTRQALEHHLVIVAVPEDVVVAGAQTAVARVVEKNLGEAARHAPRQTAVWVVAERTQGGVLVSVEAGGRRFGVTLEAVPWSTPSIGSAEPVAFLHSFR